MPAKITVAGENTFKIYIRGGSEAYTRSCVETHQTDARRDGGGKRVEDIDSWTQPLGRSLIATSSIVEFSNLILKDRNDGCS